MDKKTSKKFTSTERIRSFRYAIEGLKIAIKEEHNIRIHLVISLIVIISGFILQISNTEWLVICILISLVLSLELINSAIENLCDHISPEWHIMIKKIKDISAAAVLIASFGSVICGLIIFIPKICSLLAN